MRDEQYHTSTTSDGKTIDVANVGNPKGPMGMRSHICYVCAMIWKENQMVEFRGKWYGIPCGCHKDIVSIRKRERNNRIRSKTPEELR